MTDLRLFVAAVALALTSVACGVDPEPSRDDEARLEAEAVWEAVQDYRGWEAVDHDVQTRIHADDPAAFEGRVLSEGASVGTLVVIEHYDRGELQQLEVLTWHGPGEGWSSIHFDPQGRVIESRFRTSCEACHSSWTN